MEALLIFVLICLAVGTGAFFQSRHFMRDLERRHHMRGGANPQDVWRAAAEAAKGLRWTVSETDEGIETTHAGGCVISLAMEPQEDGTVAHEVFVSHLSYTSQFGGLIKTPHSYRAVRRKRRRIIAAVSAVPGAGEWLEVDGLN